MMNKDDNTQAASPGADAGGSSKPGKTAGSEAAKGTRPVIGADVHAYIGRQLRAVYDDVAKQPVPDRFLDLIRQLEVKTGGR